MVTKTQTLKRRGTPGSGCQASNVLQNMNLRHSVWKSCPADGIFYNYILILPERSVIVSITSMQDKDDRRIVWGCWIRQEADMVVYTALRNAKRWRRESYKIEDGALHWTNDAGISVWTEIPITDIPEILIERGNRFLDKLDKFEPPNYPNAEQDETQ